METLRRLSRGGSDDGGGLIGSSKGKVQFALTVTGATGPVCGNEDQTFGTELAGSSLKLALGKGLLEPFLQKMMTDLKISVACTKVVVNDQNLEIHELTRPISHFVIDGDLTRIALTVLAVDEVERRRLDIQQKLERASSSGRLQVSPGAPGGLKLSQLASFSAASPRTSGSSPKTPTTPGGHSPFSKTKSTKGVPIIGTLDMFAFDAINEGLRT